MFFPLFFFFLPGRGGAALGEELFSLIHETINDLEQMLNKQKFLRERGEMLKKQTIIKKQTK